MINERKEAQSEIEVVMLEQLVPQDHLLRKIDKYIDFSFIRDLTRDLYCHTNGRPAVDPVVLFKMLFIGYLYGIRSERQLVKDIEVNLAYRWFLGYSITEKIPDSSTISQNRIRRFKGTDIPQKIFDNIVFQAIEKGLVGGKILYSDSTHIKANANKRKFEKVEVDVTPKEYIEQLDIDVNADREKHNKKPLKPRKLKKETKEIKKSTTDPDSGYMMRDNKPEGFFYLDHRTVDSKNNIIMDVHVTPGNVSDSDPILKRIDRIKETFNIKPKYLGLDAGYSTNPIFKGIADREIISVVAYMSHIVNSFSGKSFPNYLNAYRIEEVLDALSDPSDDEPIHAVFERVGYTSRSTYLRIFRKEVGCAPSKYRQEIRKIRAERKNVRI